MLIVEGLSKSYDKVKVLDKLSFKVLKGELLTILGPSGSGKTTLLKIISGLIPADEGKVIIDDKIVFSDSKFIPPQKRGIGMVFQNYALWPHMKVYDNIAFPLKVRGIEDYKIRDKVRYFLKLVKLEGFEDRFPMELSGGQQQRVALARALVSEPKLLLLDEPLSNLDESLRKDMAIELKKIQRELKITTLWVTHDPQEAMLIADRIAILIDGKIIQIDEPYKVYNEPKNIKVAKLLGSLNVLPYKAFNDALGLNFDDKLTICFRPEDVKLSKQKNDKCLSGFIKDVKFLGDKIQYIVKVNEHYIEVLKPKDIIFDINEKVYVTIDKSSIKLFKDQSF